MFGLFSSPPFHDPQIGKLARSRGHWRGSLTLEASASVPLALSGTRSAPGSQAVAMARELPARFPAWRTTIEKALFEHYEPYAEAFAEHELQLPGEVFPRLLSPNHVWPHVSLVFVSVTPLDGILTVEFGYTAAWDEEHTLGVRFQSGNLIELCGSVLGP